MSFQKISRPIFAWSMYDFANSAFATSIVSVIFSVYLVQVLVPKDGAAFLGMMIPSASLWSYIVTAVMAVVILTAPFLGALADKRHWKKQLLFVFTIMGSIGTMVLLGSKPETLNWTILVIFLAFVGYELALVFYNALLTDVSTAETIGSVSGYGFALGYIGGGTCLALNLAMIKKPEWFFIPTVDPTFPTRLTFFVVGIWWLIFSIPILLWVKETIPAQHIKVSFSSVILSTFRQLKGTLIEVKKLKDLTRFLLAFFLYMDGIQTFLIMAAPFGAQAIGMSPVELMLCYLLVQFVAFVGAGFFGPLADQWSHKKVVLFTLVVYATVVIWAIFMKNSWEFWILGVIVGIILGGSQAASRSFYGNMIPEGKTSEFFSFYAVVGKASALVGPFTFGVMTHAFGIRAAMGSLLAFFILGGGLLWGVREKQ